MAHCATCHCETEAQRRARHKREAEQAERERREREFIKNHSVLRDEDVAWVRARLGSVTLDAVR